ncbi:hypothetical protein [Pandoraea pulmonicola]|uniref:Type III secretion apparatus protein, YscQ/HrcQ family n=1 Tax=Pandoraea pulmonicola TaxID=93221 RepID=A0AAJ5D020_PANPU|nr:hypothetical protein [Pandoraea pulmonicola]AJC21159.1 hypothetical protein RO07_12970 [Pandoraea pulmonicola]SUA90172.1 type III secretion apparatus protein, YscQ/HrcQ family [Pandoraea pulmonicola]
MCRESRAESAESAESAEHAESTELAASGPLDDVLTGASGCVAFAAPGMDVRVGWLRTGGDGLVVTARVDEGVVGAVRFWCDAQQWRDWLAPLLPVPLQGTLPPEWQTLATSLTLAADFVDDDVPFADATASPAAWPCATSVAPGHVATAWRTGMVLERAGRRLALAYLDGATSWLRTRCLAAQESDAPLDPAGLPQRRCALAAGWATLPSSQCDALRDGDAVLLDVAAEIEDGESWVLDDDFAIGLRDAAPSGRGVVFDGADGNTLDAAASRPSMTRLTAVIAERPFPVPLLMAWRAGRVDGVSPACRGGALPGAQAAHVVLSRDGAPWTTARLLRFGDGRLAVRIDGGLGNHGDPPCEFRGNLATGGNSHVEADGDTDTGTEADA